MTPRRMLGMFGLLAGLAAAAAPAQDPKAPASTAQPGEVVPSTFRAFLVVDKRFPPLKKEGAGKDDPPTPDPRDRTNKIHCLVSENGLSPVVAVFVRADAKALGAQSGVGKLANAVDKLIGKYRGYKLAGFVVFLKIEGMPKVVTVKGPDGSEMMIELDPEYPDDERRDEYAADIRDLANGAEAPNVPFGLAPATSKQNAAWGIGPKDEVTVVLYNRFRVLKRWKFDATGPNDQQLAEITKEVRALFPAEEDVPEEKPAEKKDNGKKP